MSRVWDYNVGPGLELVENDGTNPDELGFDTVQVTDAVRAGGGGGGAQGAVDTTSVAYWDRESIGTVTLGSTGYNAFPLTAALDPRYLYIVETTITANGQILGKELFLGETLTELVAHAAVPTNANNSMGFLYGRGTTGSSGANLLLWYQDASNLWARASRNETYDITATIYRVLTTAGTPPPVGLASLSDLIQALLTAANEFLPADSQVMLAAFSTSQDADETIFEADPATHAEGTTRSVTSPALPSGDPTATGDFLHLWVPVEDYEVRSVLSISGFERDITDLFEDPVALTVNYGGADIVGTLIRTNTDTTLWIAGLMYRWTSPRPDLS